MSVQEQISARRLQRKIGKTLRVLLDQAADGNGVGRSSADAPEIDGEVHLRDAGGLNPGDIVQARIEESDEHDLFGVPV
jgi:ribosomal protein S12 methylthiotransferase